MMELEIDVEQLKEVVQSLPEDYYGVGICDVKSWRGVYWEPAFELSKSVCKSEMLRVIDDCLTNIYYGYKGGEFTYDLFSSCNFDKWGVWSDGDYLKYWVEKYPDSEFLNKLLQIN